MRVNPEHPIYHIRKLLLALEDLPRQERECLMRLEMEVRKVAKYVEATCTA